MDIGVKLSCANEWVSGHILQMPEESTGGTTAFSEMGRSRDTGGEMTAAGAISRRQRALEQAPEDALANGQDAHDQSNHAPNQQQRALCSELHD